jgi:simple sugar transport system permease protein
MKFSRYIPTILDNLIWIILLGVFIFFSIQSQVFLTSINITNILSAAAVLGILVVGQTYVLITGNFDLSSESTLGLAALIGMFLIVPSTPPYWGGGIMINPIISIITILLLGSIIGYLVGVLITIGKMNNFIVTLAMLLILRGLMMAFTEGKPISGLNFPPAEIYFFGSVMRRFSKSQILLNCPLLLAQPR